MPFLKGCFLSIMLIVDTFALGYFVRNLSDKLFLFHHGKHQTKLQCQAMKLLGLFGHHVRPLGSAIPRRGLPAPHPVSPPGTRQSRCTGRLPAAVHPPWSHRPDSGPEEHEEPGAPAGPWPRRQTDGSKAGSEPWPEPLIHNPPSGSGATSWPDGRPSGRSRDRSRVSEPLPPG